MKRHIEKLYSQGVFDLSDPTIRRRLVAIETLTAHTPAAVEFAFDHRGLLRKSRYLPEPVTRRDLADTTLLQQLAAQLDLAREHSLTHGDIHPKNLRIAPGLGVFLVDWEPSLVQSIRGATRLMATLPWISDQDAMLFKLTLRTDLLCFARLCTFMKRSDYRQIQWAKYFEVCFKSVRPFEKLFKIIYLNELC